MEKFEVVIFILAVLLSLSAIIEKIRLPHPVFFVTAGFAIGFIPVLPDLALDPEVVFIVFLPPLLYDAAFRTSWHSFRLNIGPIFALAVSLVFFTIVAIAVTAHYLIPDFTWPLAFLLGAIISPPDAVAASGIIKGLGLNKHVVTILEGESLLNDASALIAYRYALVAVTTGTFIFWQAGLDFLLVAGGGVVIGIIIGYILVFAHRKIVNNNPLVETSLTLLTPFISYLTAEHVHTSGILAVVSTGLVISFRSPEIFSYQTRMRARVIWDTLIFLLNGFVFILIGMQLPTILKQLARYTFIELMGYGVAISIVTILIRIVWVFGGAYASKLFKEKSRVTETDGDANIDDNTWKNVLIISWTGIRGVISLAAALALPLTLSNGNAFPQRALILFLCFVVIFVTLVVQGLSLPFLVRLLRIKPAGSTDKEAKELELFLVNSTLDFIDNEFALGHESIYVDQLKNKYESRARQLSGEIEIHDQHAHAEQGEPTALTAIQNAQLKIAKFQRELLLKIHKENIFTDTAIKQAEQNMDVADLQFDQQLPVKTR